MLWQKLNGFENDQIVGSFDLTCILSLECSSRWLCALAGSYECLPAYSSPVGSASGRHLLPTPVRSATT